MPSFNFNLCATSVFLSTLCLLTLTSEAVPVYSTHFCENATFTPNSTYQANLNSVLSALSANSARSSSGFYNTTTGREPPDVVYGLFLCRGDLSTDACQDCVATAARDILRRCREAKVSYIWFDQCMLRYSNQSIFSIINEVPGFDLPDSQNVTEPERFNPLLASTMNDLASRAAIEQNGKRFATEEENFTSNQTLYTLAQCTPDLSEFICNRCFRSAIAALPMCCTGKQGGRVLLPSCNIRYQLYPFYQAKDTALVPSPSTKKSKARGKILLVTAVVVPIVVSILLVVLSICWLRRRALKRYNTLLEKIGDEISAENALQFDLATIQAATRNFLVDNRIGEGGFGAVYRGILYNGREIAVKRLSIRSGQGEREFKNEVALVTKLQHRNLVRLLGYCLDGNEKMLVYEYVPNKSLDYFLFEPGKQRQLDWPKRYNIILGVARGILYLHEDSRLRIIHRDLKASNILLDEDMNAKIADFGMARIFGVDQTQANTNRIVGTFGYMSPEYAMHGQYSVKSDVYSFGVLVLEIVSGKRSSGFYQSGGDQDLLSYAWRNWRQETPLDFMDPALGDSYSVSTLIRSIHIGLLCVQENPANRPTMPLIILMLERSTIALPLPEKPGYFVGGGQELETQTMELESNQSTSKSTTRSVNEMSISELYPR